MLENPELLKQLVLARMPFGKYAGRFLVDLPVAYLIWFEKKGFPKGEIGEQLMLMYQLKMDGNGDVLRMVQSKLTTNK